MKVVTIHQPYAWLVVQGIKKWENRTWNLNMRGPLLIHAGVSHRWWNKLSAHTKSKLPRPEATGYTLGALVGAANFTDCRPVIEVHNDLFATGPYCWKFENAVAFAEPIYIKGKQGIWNVDIEVVAEQLDKAGFVPREMKLGGRAA